MKKRKRGAKVSPKTRSRKARPAPRVSFAEAIFAAQKKADVKAKRSKAAKKGWATRKVKKNFGKKPRPRTREQLARLGSNDAMQQFLLYSWDIQNAETEEEREILEEGLRILQEENPNLQEIAWADYKKRHGR